jgi:hypothetical protein
MVKQEKSRARGKRAVGVGNGGGKYFANSPTIRALHLNKNEAPRAPANPLLATASAAAAAYVPSACTGRRRRPRWRPSHNSFFKPTSVRVQKQQPSSSRCTARSRRRPTSHVQGSSLMPVGRPAAQSARAPPKTEYPVNADEELGRIAI